MLVSQMFCFLSEIWKDLAFLASHASNDYWIFFLILLLQLGLELENYFPFAFLLLLECFSFFLKKAHVWSSWQQAAPFHPLIAVPSPGFTAYFIHMAHWYPCDAIPATMLDNYCAVYVDDTNKALPFLFLILLLLFSQSFFYLPFFFCLSLAPE